MSATDVVFVGTAFDIQNPPPAEVLAPATDGQVAEDSVQEPPSDEDPPGADTSVADGLSRYRFTVDENIAGTAGKEIDVYSGRGGTDCSYHFELGHQYLVFPYRGDDSRLVAVVCSSTRPIEGAGAILPQLRAMRDHQRVASLYGIARSTQQPYLPASDDSTDGPLSYTRVELRSEDKTFVSVTDSNGAYAFYDVPGGEYHFAGELPEHLEFAQESVGGPLPPLSLPAGSCFESDLAAIPTGNIRGRALGPDGKPLTFGALYLFRREKYSAKTAAYDGWYEWQDRKKGYFEFQNVGPGDYLLIYNSAGRMNADAPYPRTFYPGVPDLASAKVIHLEAGQHFDDADIRLSGGQPTHEVTIRLVAEAGQLPDINYVEGKGSDDEPTSEDELSPGVYAVTILNGLHYDFHGQGYCSTTGKELMTEPAQIDGSDESVTELTLVFRAPGCPRGSPR